MKFLLLFLVSFSSFAQINLPVPQVSFDQNPGHLRWKKIDTKHFELIFTEEITNSAQIVAKILESAHPHVIKSLGVVPPKISIILQNRNLNSNGFVTLAPRRSEFFMTPSFDAEMTNTEWLTTLGIHEFRHVVQFEKTNQGFTNLYRIFLGEIGEALGLAFTTPPWFLEGDAVGIETAITKGGRGRLPLFERELKALYLNNEPKLDELMFGSYKYQVPSHYVYGYFFTSFLRDQLKDEYSKLIDSSAKTSWNPLSFYYRFEDLTGNKFDDFVNQQMKEIITFWKNQVPTPHIVTDLGPEVISTWTNYLYPQIISDESLFSLKHGLADINQFVEIKNGEERVIYYPAPFNGKYPIKMRSGHFALIEQEYHPRWGLVDYSKIKVINLEGETVFEKKMTKYRFAVINHDGSRILGVTWDEFQKQSIVLTDLKTGIEKTYEVDSAKVITSIDWLSENEVIYVSKDFESLKSINKLDVFNLNTQTLYGPVDENLGFITYENKRILVESPLNGIDNIYELKNGELVQLTDSILGSYSPTIFKDEMYFNDYRFSGMTIAKAQKDQVVLSHPGKLDLYERFESRESKYNFKEQDDFEVKDYKRLKNTLNFHSWNLLSPVISPTLAFEAYSRDLLNENALTTGAFYNYNEGTLGGHVTGSYMRKYPVINYSAFYQGRSVTRNHSGKTSRDRWEEGGGEIGIMLPWKKLLGRYTQNFSFYGFNRLQRVMGKKPFDKSEVNDGAFYTAGITSSFSHLSRMSPRDLLPEIGFSVDAHIEKGQNISGSELKGHIFSVDSKFYLPGFKKHHSFYQQFAYENQKQNDYEFMSRVLFSRGMTSFFLDKFYKYSANYTLPVLYPDQSFGQFIYLKRVSANIFYDDLRGSLANFKYDARSLGTELLFETYLLRLMTPVTIGLRYTYGIEGFKEQDFGVFFNTTLATF